MSLHLMRPRFRIEAVVGGKPMATEALKSNPRHLHTCKQSDVSDKAHNYLPAKARRHSDTLEY
ncbi:hypothetical protein E2C01_023583 [Portunus trituberculatus]|uniref:Uncharacterized protein n=1 Tax=Portunus trituberculatus TaxID=210409 RepID=A0A5B7E8L2_PORTR|nr:hypothetical protein [Portunus trituberculatus]